MEFDGHKLKTKAYVLLCRHDHHDLYAWPNDAFESFLRCMLGLGAEVEKLFTSEEVQHELETKDFYGYSTLMFICYFNCLCDSVYYNNKILQSLQINGGLRNITKIFLDYSCGIAFNKTGNSYTEDILSKDKFEAIERYLREEEQKRIMKENLTKINNAVFITCQITGFYSANYDESIDDTDDDNDMQQWRSENIPNGERNFLALITEKLSKFANQKSIQEILQVVENDIKTFELSEMLLFETTSTGGYYLFNINPALFIAINHLTFQNLSFRTGAEKDLEAIKKACGQQRIPHLIIEDATSEEALELLHFIQTTDLSILKHLFVCIMSHGDDGDIIYTKTSSYTADDVKRALLKNPSLKQVKKLLFLNFCRGGFHPEYALIDEPQPLELTDASDLDDTTVVLYSARKGCVSLREKEGSPCVQKFTVELEKCFKKLSVPKMRERMENYLLKTYVDFKSMTELVSKHGADHIFKMEFQNTSDFMELFKNIELAALSKLLVNGAQI